MAVKNMRIFSRLNIDGPLQIRSLSSCFFRGSVEIYARALLEPKNGCSRSTPLTSCVPLCCSVLQCVPNICQRQIILQVRQPLRIFGGVEICLKLACIFVSACVHKGKFSLSGCSFLLEIQVADTAMALVLLLCVENCGRIVTSFM